VLKMHRGMADMMKAMGRQKGGGIGAALGQMFGVGQPGPAQQPSPEQMAAIEKQMTRGLPKGFTPPGGLPGLGGPKLPTGLGLPGLPGLPGLGPKDPTKK
jgi:signal recognition particle subunit SRP54